MTLARRIDPARIEDARCASALVDVVRRAVKLERDGREYRGLCPFHADTDPSFTVVPERGFYHCFGCGAHGDAIDFAMELYGLDFPAAVELIAGGTIVGGPVRRDGPPAPLPGLYDGYTPIVPVPDTAPRLHAGRKTPPLLNPKRIDDPKRREWRPIPARVFEYRLADGALYGLVLRVEIEGGGKITPMAMWCRCPDGAERWVLRPFPEPRPLYGLEALAAAPEAEVVVPEGETDTEAARRLLPEAVVVTWPGGTNAIEHTDWSALQGRRVRLWPDNDRPGKGAMVGLVKRNGSRRRGVAELLAPIAAEVFIADVADCPGGKGGGAADCARAGWTPGQTAEWLAARLRPASDFEPVVEPAARAPSADDPPPPSEPPPEGDPPPPPEPPDAGTDPERWPFRVLGYDRDFYYFYPHGTAQLVQMTAGQINKANLLKLAPLFWWETQFPGRGSFNVSMAANTLLRMAERQGVYVPRDRRRGRGAWFDDGRAVMNLGDRLVVDGTPTPLHLVRTRNLYEAGDRVDLAMDRPLTTREAYRLLEVADALRWERKVSAHLLAGWCVIAPLSGVLRWRPHIWVTGPAMSGKTTVVVDIIGRTLGPLGLSVQGKSSEAGIRQMLEQDALPVVFDESEQGDEFSRRDVQAVIELARIASSGGVIFKGSQGQSGSRAYRVRSCFCFSSINVGVQSYQDETRITPLVLLKNDPRDEEERDRAAEHYKELRRLIDEVLTPDFAGRLLARSLSILPTIQANIETFTSAAAVLLNRRIADQLGPMLAGVYALHSAKAISLDGAIDWLGKWDWSESAPIDAERNENALLSTILQHKVPLKLVSGAVVDRTLGELVAAAAFDKDRVPADEARQVLLQHGIKPDGAGIWISNTHREIKRLLGRTPWAAKWQPALKAIEGARPSLTAEYFGPGAISKAVWVPLEAFLLPDSGEQPAPNREPEEMARL